MRLSHLLPLAAIALLPQTAFAAQGDAAAGLAAIQQYNLIVLGDMNASHDVEGKTLIGGNLNGSSATFGLGNSNQGAATSSAPTLTVGGTNNLSNTNINNGSNGTSGTVSTGAGFWVGGSATGNINLNGSGPHNILVGGNLGGNPNVNSGDTLKVGGNIPGVLSVNGGTAQLGGSAGSVNNNSGSYQAGLGAGFQSGLVSTVTSTTSQTIADVKALSTALAGLTVINPSSLSNDGQTLFLNAVDGGSGYALFNIDASAFSSLSQISYVLPNNTLPVIINVTGASAITFGLNPVGGDTSAANQQVIWNFVDATSLDITTLFHGSVLAPNATLTNHTPIEGSVVAASFVQDGEVHLGTYDGNGSFLTPPTAAVPEPAIWAMMVLGFGLVGTSLRRRAVVTARA